MIADMPSLGIGGIAIGASFAFARYVLERYGHNGNSNAHTTQTELRLIRQMFGEQHEILKGIAQTSAAMATVLTRLEERTRAAGAGRG